MVYLQRLSLLLSIFLLASCATSGSNSTKSLLDAGTHRSELIEKFGEPESSDKNAAGFNFDIFKLTESDLNPESDEGMGFWETYFAISTLGLSTLLTSDDSGSEKYVRVKVTYNREQRIFNTQFNRNGQWVSSSEL